MIRVGICEDDPMFRGLLTEFLDEQEGMEVVWTADTRQALLRNMESVQPDVLLLDIHLSEHGHDGLEAALEIHRQGLPTKVIVLSSMDEAGIILDAVTVGRVANYITKQHYHDIPQAIRDVHENRTNIHHSSAGALLGRLIGDQEQRLRSQITPLQIQILELLDQGLDRKQIADKLFYTEQSVHNEIFKITKLLKGKFPYLEWFRLKKHNAKEIVELAKKLSIIP